MKVVTPSCVGCWVVSLLLQVQSQLRPCPQAAFEIVQKQEIIPFQQGRVVGPPYSQARVCEKRNNGRIFVPYLETEIEITGEGGQKNREQNIELV